MLHNLLLALTFPSIRQEAKVSKGRRLASGESAVGGATMTAKPFSRARRRETLSAAAAASRRLRVAARLLRAVTPARGKPKFHPTRMGVERAEGPSRVVRAAP